ncbi:glycoside hydrolase family 25 protein [Hoeflea prorocentri]|uniref:GH25 family lysozyme n=1 Tax=Hoeflea prorocentri TaxID=1922333 RepID=A0A9X3ZGG8_9HYPH|nr:GH25 family lysozyme [Hoeflea prorocentri]MCY6379888.1 GH25 family lysozyme [Hoeflea prorocentri]MDA5397688.1 GH25 family lysozyme [Hoeflea prorocentri]
MPRFGFALIPLLLTLSSCMSYDLGLEPEVSPSRYGDSDPQYFGDRHPAKHQIHGIDVSKWQGDINWNKLRRADIAFAFIKSTEGGDHRDERFDTYWHDAKRAGIPRGAYHFFYFCRPAIEQAQWFIANTPRDRSALPPVLDVEWNHHSKTCKLRPEPTTVRREMKVFLDAVEKHYGKRPLIYTTVDFHRQNLEGHFAEYQFWLRSVADHPDNVYHRRTWHFWQYTGTGRVPGIDGDTDINVFVGNKDQWAKWLQSARSP